VTTQLDFFISEEEEESKYEGVEHVECMKCGKSLPNTQDYFPLKVTTVSLSGDKTYWLGKTCKPCRLENLSVTHYLKKKHLKDKGDCCEACGVDTDALYLDHDHNTNRFRGWLCGRCNTGIGKLGDNIEGVRKALEYLERTSDPDA
jgi:hypothetical protein